MRCSKCNQENPKGIRFCTTCGMRLTQRCLQCGSENSITNRFCGQCGKALNIIKENVGTQLDKAVVESFLQIFR